MVPTTFVAQYPKRSYVYNPDTGVGVHNYRKGFTCSAPEEDDFWGSWNHDTWTDGKNYSEPAKGKCE